MQPATRRWLIIIVFAGAALRLFPIWFGLPYPQARPDEETALGKAVEVIDGQLNPRFFHWPSLTFYLFAMALWTARAVHGLVGDARELTFADNVLLARGVVALAGTATIVVLFQLARRVTTEGTALLAAAFLAVAILHVRESHFAMTDVLMTLLVVTSLAHLLRGVCSPDDEVIPKGATLWCAVAGLAGGLAASTKYSGAAVAASMAAAQVSWFVRSPRLALSWRAWMPSLAYGAALLAGFFVATPYAILDHELFVRDLRFDATHLSEGHGAVNLGRGWIYHLTQSLPHGVGLTVAIAAVLGVIPFARYYRRAAFVLGAFAAGFYLVIGSGYTVFFRYILPLVPLACLSAAVGVSHAGTWLASRLGGRQVVVTGALILVTAGPALVHCVWFDLLLARTDTRVLAGQWLESRLQPEDSLHDAGSNYTQLDLWRAGFHRWFYDPAANSFGDPDGRTPDWLVLHDSPVSAYASIPPGLRVLAQSEYVLVYNVRGTRGRARAAVYDLQDAFFLPFTRFTTIERPGPNISVYRRRDLPPLQFRSSH
ncbi:MAG: phospholipid carrier-dependent glycosyltransferase [Acidobacteria bacterium]|nr:phospholipid carrier-dependent glycosyltransferase [Acidobacteriota bacterium]